MSGEGLASATRFLVLCLSALYVLGALAGLFLLDFDTTSGVVLWLGFLLGGAALMLIGQLARALPAWPSAVLVSIGAAAGGIPLFWTIIVPLAVAAIVACSIKLARSSVAPA